jgi:hypothetical protein
MMLKISFVIDPSENGEDNININLQQPAMFVFFGFSHNCLITNCASFQDLSAGKM